jgi:hypothetical protein
MSQTKLESWKEFDPKDIPYVAAWSLEREISIVPCVYARGPAIVRKQRRGQGTPILGKMDEARQRECMAGRLCQVCHQPVRLGQMIALESPDAVTLPGWISKLPLLLEPPACEPCARKAIELCPGIARHRAAGTLRCFRVLDDQLVAQEIGPAGNGDALDRALANYRGKPPVGYLKLALTRFEELDVGYFASTGPRRTRSNDQEKLS